MNRTYTKNAESKNNINSKSKETIAMRKHRTNNRKNNKRNGGNVMEELINGKVSISVKINGAAKLDEFRNGSHKRSTEYTYNDVAVELELAFENISFMQAKSKFNNTIKQVLSNVNQAAKAETEKTEAVKQQPRPRYHDLYNELLEVRHDKLGEYMIRVCNKHEFELDSRIKSALIERLMYAPNFRSENDLTGFEISCLCQLVDFEKKDAQIIGAIYEEIRETIDSKLPSEWHSDILRPTINKIKSHRSLALDVIGTWMSKASKIKKEKASAVEA